MKFSKMGCIFALAAFMFAGSGLAGMGQKIAIFNGESNIDVVTGMCETDLNSCQIEKELLQSESVIEAFMSEFILILLGSIFGFYAFRYFGINKLNNSRDSDSIV